MLIILFSCSLESRDDKYNVLTFSWRKVCLSIFTGNYDGIKQPLWQFGLRLNPSNVLEA